MSVIDCFSLAVLTVDCAVRTTVRPMFTDVLVTLHFHWYGETVSLAWASTSIILVDLSTKNDTCGSSSQ